MATAADVAFLDNALAQLEGVRRWTPRTISKLEALIGSDDPWDVYRVDPLTFAAEKSISEQEAIDLFLPAVHRHGLKLQVDVHGAVSLLLPALPAQR